MRRLLWPLVGLVVVVVGVVWALVAPPVGDYGWFASTPLDPDLAPPASNDGTDLLLSTGQVVGIVIAAVGVVVLAAWGGFGLGRRRGRRGPS